MILMVFRGPGGSRGRQKSEKNDNENKNHQQQQQQQHRSKKRKQKKNADSYQATAIPVHLASGTPAVQFLIPNLEVRERDGMVVDQGDDTDAIDRGLFKIK